MTDAPSPAPVPAGPPPYLAPGARYAAGLVAAVLEHAEQLPPPPPSEVIMAGCTWLGQLMFAVQLGGGADPRAARELLIGGDRGADLARQFLSAGSVEVCCEYCGALMAASLAGAAGQQLAALHGPAEAPRAWQALTAVILPGEPPFPPDGPQPASHPYLA